jgi:hypothetical protein
VGQASTSTRSNALASERRTSVRTRWARAIVTAGVNIRNRSNARAIGLTPSPRALIRSGVNSAISSLDVSKIEQTSVCSIPSTEISSVEPPVASRRVSTALSQALRTSAQQSSQTSPGTIPIRRPEASPPASSSPKSAPPRSRQSATSRQRGPETIAVVSRTWCPAIAERPKVGFSPVRPQ